MLKSIFISLFLLIFFSVNSQNKDKANVYVDDQGVMRWEKTGREVTGFGVNYSVPFAHAYRTAERLGIDHKEAIDNDIYHFKKLGFDLYRIHVWDTEISDSLGNLLDNEHLDLFDYLLSELAKKEINYVLTPIAYWGSGWPEPDPETPGFSYTYGKGECLTDEACIKAQQNYLEQFMNHVNRYNGIAYKDDPNLIAVEISNEPHHREEPEVVTAFVEKMVKAIKRSGSRKPVFYNASHAVHLNKAYFEAGIDGGTFQWYPTGLGYQREIPGNLLPNVNKYHIPFNDVIDDFNGAKLVYEFDAADVGRNYIYPVMARSFREAGIQIATHFAYDPTYMADVNTEYNTHYMNLNYTPQKALALMISGKVFHEVPMEQDFGSYPGNTSFGDFTVSYQQDLATYNSPETFIYTNDNKINPKKLKELKKVAGFGNSAVVKYSGKGAYFLDRLDKGVWRLEVLPDAIWVDNPFGRNSPEKIVGVIKWKEHQMTLHLDDLGDEISITAINDSNSFITATEGNTFSIIPGTYIVTQAGAKNNWTAEDDFEGYRLNSFYAPNSTVEKLWVKHDPPGQISENKPLTLSAQVVSDKDPLQVTLVGYSKAGRIVQKMEETSAYQYSSTIDPSMLKNGMLHYHIVVLLSDSSYMTYPAGKPGQPWDWDFYDRKDYQIAIVPEEYPIYLFDAYSDHELLVRQWRRNIGIVPTEDYRKAEYQIILDQLFVQDNENPNAKPIYDYSVKHYVRDHISGRYDDLPKKRTLVIEGRALQKPEKIQVALVMDNGAAFGGMIELNTRVKEYELDLSALEPVRTVTLPRPYPTFLPYYFDHSISEPFDIKRIESIQISIGPGLSEDQLQKPHNYGIRRIWLK